MQGVETLSSAGSVVVNIATISDEMKDAIRSRLSAYCHGAVHAAEDAVFYSFPRTVAEFLRRFDTKPARIQTGMIGELLVHMFVATAYPGLRSGAVFFNKEERSMKKGFDLTFHEESNRNVWYGEVKSSSTAKHDSDARSRKLLTTAAVDLLDKLGSRDRQSTWESALLDADLALESDAASSLKGLLRLDSLAAERGELGASRGLLGAVIFHSADTCALTMAAALSGDDIDPPQAFSAVRTISIQQSAIDQVVDFLRDEVAAGD